MKMLDFWEAQSLLAATALLHPVPSNCFTSGGLNDIYGQSPPQTHRWESCSGATNSHGPRGSVWKGAARHGSLRRTEVISDIEQYWRKVGLLLGFFIFKLLLCTLH